VTGRGVVSAQVVEGSVLDRAAEALQGARPGVVQLDPATAEMLDTRFVVDGEHARFVQADTDNTLRTVSSLDSASAHQRSHDIGTDRPGRDAHRERGRVGPDRDGVAGAGQSDIDPVEPGMHRNPCAGPL